MIILGKCQEVVTGGVWIIFVVGDEYKHEFALVDDPKDTFVDVFSFKLTIYCTH